MVSQRSPRTNAAFDTYHRARERWIYAALDIAWATLRGDRLGKRHRLVTAFKEIEFEKQLAWAIAEAEWKGQSITTDYGVRP